MTRMLNTHWLGNAGNFFMLFLVTSAISNLSSEEMSNRCNSKTVIPELDIFSSPPNRTLRVGADINLTCIAWPRNDHQLYPRKWTKYIQWYDPQGSPVGAKCLQGTPRVKELHCILMLKRLTMEQFGNYTCEAQNDYEGYCTQKVVEIELQASLAPEIVEDPKNQTVDAGFNATFDCAAKGHPMPSITWIKNDDALAVQSNNWTRVAEIFLDDEQIHSKLVIKGVKREDDGKYYCFTNNSAGEKASKPAFLSTKDPASSTTAPPIKEQRRSVPLLTTLGVCVGAIIAFMGGCIMAFLYRRARRNHEGNEGAEEIYVACIDNKDLAEVILKDINADTEESELLEVNAVTSSLVVENNKMQLNKKKHAHDDWRVESIPRVSSEERTPTPLDVGDKHFPNSIFDQKGYAEELFNSRNGHQSAEDGCSHCDVNIISYQDSGMDSDKDTDEIQTSLFIEIEESEKDRGTLEVLDEVLGEGEYGIVYKGLYGERNGSTTDVAVKKLKGNACTLAKAALLNEIRTLKQAGRHPNIVNLIGTWVQGETILVVTELVHGGSLESFLRCKGDGSNKYANVHCKLNDRQLLKIALQVALGMKHLEEQKCIHRDLAARNVLIDPNMVAKVGDFGLAREITEDGLYIKTSCGKVPWRWSSLESLRDRVYTSKSDVWSFGILLWEMATYGDSPYPDIPTPLALVSRLSTGYRMSRPHQCSEELYTLMRSCWNEDPLMRPSFADIVDQLAYFLREVKRIYINITEDEISGSSEVN
ncbi:fibroblast growth factor receptor 3-like [Pocillopora verrucosa]|uniref:fibroblast growth factor receptor 3-like n=1 Tax=Pocillopora verrucosa TaxID=203993 RepID=UPI0027971A52|nr:fibroblast growth factor receptor 3-like [Pocillopora verrucosa]